MPKSQNKNDNDLMDKIVSLCKRRGFIFPGSEIYGGLANSWDYGPYGVEMKNNIKQKWWKVFVQERDDMVGLDAAIIMNPRVWEASGHVENFSDPLVECKNCHQRFRADVLVKSDTNLQAIKLEYVTQVKRILNKASNKINSQEKDILVLERMREYLNAENFSPEEKIKLFSVFQDILGKVEYKHKNLNTALEFIKYIIEELNNSDKFLGLVVWQYLKRYINCPNQNCGANNWEIPRPFNLMFKTFIGPAEETANVAYLRPENAQGMFVNFKNVLNTTRRRLPFGIAQIGRNFRNEITPGNFIFRTREFEIAELEYFIEPKGWEKMFEMWLEEIRHWWRDVMQVNMDNLVWHEIPESERAHYSQRTVDIEYKYPFGVKELHGIAYRTDFDLRRHEEVSGEDLRYADPDSGKKFLPHVIEPTFGVDRMLLVSLLEAYHEEAAPTAAAGETDTRVVMKFPSWLAPIKIAVLPLSKKENLSKLARQVYDELRPCFVCEYDETQSIGKRYRRQDEIGTPYCVTVDFESLEDKAVTVRERDTMEQERIKIGELNDYFRQELNN